MTTRPDMSQQTVAEQETQRAAEQEALRNVRRLTDLLEQEQRARQRFQRTAWLVGVIAVIVFGLVVYALYMRTTSVPPSSRIEVPPKVTLPQK